MHLAFTPQRVEFASRSGLTRLLSRCIGLGLDNCPHWHRLFALGPTDEMTTAMVKQSYRSPRSANAWSSQADTWYSKTSSWLEQSELKSVNETTIPIRLLIGHTGYSLENPEALRQSSWFHLRLTNLLAVTADARALTENCLCRAGPHARLIVSLLFATNVTKPKLGSTSRLPISLAASSRAHHANQAEVACAA